MYHKTKKCSICKKIKSIKDFYYQNKKLNKYIVEGNYASKK